MLSKRFNLWDSDKIREYINEGREDVTALEIEKELGIKAHTARTRLSELYHKNLIARIFHGHYSCFKTHTLDFAQPFLIHNFNAVVVVNNIHEMFNFVREIEAGKGKKKHYSKLRLYTGKTNKKINWIISSSKGIDVEKFRLYQWLVEDELEDHGYPFPNNWLASLEANHDFEGYRLDGVQVFTWRSIDGVLTRIYNKNNKLRFESKIPKTLDIDSVFALLKRGNINDYNFAKLSTDVIKKVDGIDENIKRLNSRMSNIEKFQYALLERLNSATIYVGNKDNVQIIKRE